MKNTKRIIIMLIIITSLVPMIVFAGESKFINLVPELFVTPQPQVSLTITNYKDKSSEYKDKTLSLIGYEDNKKIGYFEYPVHVDAVFNTAVVKGGTTLKVSSNQKVANKKQTFAMLRVYPIVEKRDNAEVLIGRPVKSVSGNLGTAIKMDLLQKGEYIVELLLHTEDRGAMLEMAYLKVE